jgi:hypothetical protein
MQGFPVQASCHQSASTASPFARKLVPYTLAAQVDVCATERAVSETRMVVVRKSMW